MVAALSGMISKISRVVPNYLALVFPLAISRSHPVSGMVSKNLCP